MWEIDRRNEVFLSAIHFEKPLNEDQMFIERLQSNTKKNDNRYIDFQRFRGSKLRIKKDMNTNGVIKTEVLDKARLGFIALNGRCQFFF